MTPSLAAPQAEVLCRLSHVLSSERGAFGKIVKPRSGLISERKGFSALMNPWLGLPFEDLHSSQNGVIEQVMRRLRHHLND